MVQITTIHYCFTLQCHDIATDFTHMQLHAKNKPVVEHQGPKALRTCIYREYISIVFTVDGQQVSNKLKQCKQKKNFIAGFANNKHKFKHWKITWRPQKHYASCIVLYELCFSWLSCRHKTSFRDGRTTGRTEPETDNLCWLGGYSNTYLRFMVISVGKQRSQRPIYIKTNDKLICSNLSIC